MRRASCIARSTRSSSYAPGLRGDEHDRALGLATQEERCADERPRAQLAVERQLLFVVGDVGEEPIRQALLELGSTAREHAPDRSAIAHRIRWIAVVQPARDRRLRGIDVCDGGPRDLRALEHGYDATT